MTNVYNVSVPIFVTRKHSYVIDRVKNCVDLASLNSITGSTLPTLRIGHAYRHTMTVEDILHAPTNRNGHGVPMDTAGILPGTTFPTKLMSGESDKDHITTQSQPGPTVDLKATTITLYASRDLKATGLIPQMHDLINNAFGTSHSA